LTVPLLGGVCAGPLRAARLGNPVCMFGTFDRADPASVGSIRALDEALLGIREDGRPISVIRHGRSEAAADSSAFMFGVHAEQPPSSPLAEPPLCLWASELD